MTIYTVGHSTRSAAEFVELLRSQSIECLVDVRQFPGSRRFPHFSAEALAASLAEGGIDYIHLRDLGGRRAVRPDSPNTYWKNASFRAYADHMSTPEFHAAFEQLLALAVRQRTAIMCAEAVPWRCHRWLIADALVSADCEVIHIIDAKHVQPHVLNPHAQQGPDGNLTYAASPGQGSLF